MFDSKSLDDLVKVLCEAIPPGLRDMQKDLERNFHSILQSWFAKMDLVTREEFDVQINVLKRTRKKVETLEKKLEELEKHSPPKKK